MIGWFRRKRPAPEPAWTMATEDVRIASAWGLGYLEWRALTDQERTWFRTNLATALTNSRNAR